MGIPEREFNPRGSSSSCFPPSPSSLEQHVGQHGTVCITLPSLMTVLDRSPQMFGLSPPLETSSRLDLRGCGSVDRHLSATSPHDKICIRVLITSWLARWVQLPPRILWLKRL